MQLFVNARFLTSPLTGVQRYGIEISRQIRKLDPTVRFLTPGNIVHQEAAEELGAERVGNTLGHIWEQTELPRFLRRFGSPPLLNPGNTGPLFYRNNYITIHDLAFLHFPHWNSAAFSNWYRFLVPRLAKNARHVFTVSHTVKQELMTWFSLPEFAISVTYNGIAREFLRYSGNERKDALILAVGSINQRKGYENLVRGFLDSYVSKTHQLIIAGRSDKIYRTMPDLSNEHPALRVEGALSDEALRNLYQRAEILVSLSEYEGFGLPVLEGLFFGCKILCSDIPVYKELYSDYSYFCKPRNIREISLSLENLAELPASVSARESAMKRFDYTQSALTILEQMVSRT